MGTTPERRNTENKYIQPAHSEFTEKANKQDSFFSIRKILVWSGLVGLFSIILAIFYYQETQYLLPTPLPDNYQKVPVGQQIQFHKKLPITFDKPIVLHFFNPQCPCSRFNLEHVQRLISKYQDKVNFYAVLQAEDKEGAIENFKEKYDLAIPVILDDSKQVAIACGVYSTPQAAIINTQGELYYRGNYNKARYCTDPNSNYAQMAMDSLLAGKPSPMFIELATQSYGCELPDETGEINLSTTFTF